MRAFGFLSSTAGVTAILETSSLDVDNEILLVGVSSFNDSLKYSHI